MSVAEIQRAVSEIKQLPTQERIRMYHWTLGELENEAVYAAFDQAFASGHYDAIVAETDEEYRQGLTLPSIY
jgi:hypothetical protein